jgi:O-antigen/teichoic acid export membrane protein
MQQIIHHPMTNSYAIAALASEQPAHAVAHRVPSLRNNFAWTFVGNMIYAGCQWGMLSALAKLGNPFVVGQFTLGLAIGAPVFMFTNLQLRAVQATDVRRETEFADYFTLRLLATLAGLIVIAGLLPFAASTTTVRLVIFLVAISKCVECMSDVAAGLLQREEKLKRVAISLMMRGAGSVVAFSLAFAYFRNLACAVLAIIAVWLAVLLLYDAANAKAVIPAGEGIFRLNFTEMRRMVLLSLPLGWVATFASLYVNIPRYFIQHYMGLADQGIYASLAYLVVVINLIVAALSVSVTTRLARLFADGELRQFVRLLTKLSMIGVLITAVGVPLTFLVGRPLLTLVYRREYADHVGLLALFVGIAGLSTIASFLLCGLTAARAFRSQVPVYFAAMLIGVLGSALLVPRYGLIGAGAGLLLAASAAMLGGLFVISKVIRGNAQ